MTALVHALDSASVRFAISGSLITIYLLADRIAARRGLRWTTPATPRWVHPVVAVSLLGFYLLIGPTGGPLFAGLGNVAGGVLGVLGAALRFSRGVRYPQLAGRGLLYLALPLAVGAPWGWLVLTLPACITSAVCAWRADRALAAAGGRAPADLPGYRVLPGIW